MTPVPQPRRWSESLGSALAGAHGRLIYSAFGFSVGLVNLIVQRPLAPDGDSPVRLLFLILAMLLLTVIPTRPAPGLTAFTLLFVALFFSPGTFASDFMIAGLAYLLFLGRYLRSTIATAFFLGVLSTFFLASAFHGTDGAFGVALTLFGSALIPAGALIRWTEQTWQARATEADEHLQAIRLEVAREMHDLVAYSMSQTALRARRAAADSSYPDAARQEFAALEATAADALHELRLLLRALRQDPPDPTRAEPTEVTGLGHVTVDLGAAVAAVAQDVAAAGFDVTFRTTGDISLGRAQATALSRVAREMGANIIRHASIRSPVTFFLQQDEASIHLVSTDTTRLEARLALPSSGMGVLGMRERLAAVDGTLSTLEEDGLWMVTATVPVSPRPTVPTPVSIPDSPSPDPEDLPA